MAETKDKKEQKVVPTEPVVVPPATPIPTEADKKTGQTDGDASKAGEIVSYCWPDSYEGRLHNQGEAVSPALIVGYNTKEKVASLWVFPNSSQLPHYVIAVKKGDDKTPNSYF